MPKLVEMPNHFHCILEIVEATNPVNDNGSDETKGNRRGNLSWLP